MRQSLLAPQGERRKSFGGRAVRANGAASFFGHHRSTFPAPLASEAESPSRAGPGFHREWRTLNDALTACIIVS